MPTIIDQLLVTLGLDAADFEKGADKANAAQKKLGDQAGSTAKDVELQEKKLAAAQAARAKELEARAKQIAQGVSKIRNEALALFAAFTGGKSLIGFVENTITTAAGLDRMSANLGMSAKDLSTWQLAAKNAGGTAEGMSAQLKQAAGDIAAYKLGQGLSPALTVSLRFGVTSADLKDANSLLMAQADILKKMYADSPTEAMEAAKLMGINEENFNLLKLGSVEVQKHRQAQAALAEQLAEASKPAEDLRKKMDALTNSFNASSVKILTTFMPAMEGALGIMKKVADALNDEEFMGESTARVMAFFGNKEAQAALDTNKKDFSTLLRRPGAYKGEDEELARRRKLPATIDRPVTNAVVGDKSPAPASIDRSNSDTASVPVAGRPAVMDALPLENPTQPATSKPKFTAPPAYPKTPTPTSGNPGAGAVFAELEKRDGLPAGVLDSMWQQESGRGKNMLSDAGAKGHFQFMDATAKQYGLKDPNNLAESADAASRMMHDLLKKYNGDLSMALMAYNGGQGNLDRKGAAGMPAESKAYAPSIMSRMEDPNKGKRQAAEVATMFNVTEQGRRNAMAAVHMANNVSAYNRPQNDSRGTSNNTSTTDVKVGQITVQTQATDAEGIAKDIGSAIKKYGFMSQANTGLS